MSYRFRKDEAVADAVRRIAADQLDMAIAAAGQRAVDPNEAVHEIRRCCKRLRALTRLIRGSLRHFNRYDNWFRDTAATLSDVRDAAVVPATHAVVVGAASALAESPQFSKGSAQLTVGELADRLGQVRERLIAVRANIDDWRLHRSGFDAVREGLRLTYKRSRTAMRKALRSENAVDCHEWRKRVKYHALQTQLLHETWPGAMQARNAAADELGDLLGRIHDLDVYRDVIDEASNKQELRSTAKQFRGELLERCRPLAKRLFSQKPAAFLKEVEAWWEASRVE